MSVQPDQSQLAGLARSLHMLILDVDGVMTDGGIILIGKDQEAKRFDVQDGMGITLARAAGLKIGIITSRTSEVVQRRAEELNIDEVIQGARSKTDVLNDLVSRHGVERSQIAYMGDDIQDIPIMERVGIPIAVQNAVSAVKACSVYVTQASGGHGAVREAVEWLLDLRNEMEKARGKVIAIEVVRSHG